MQGSGFRVQGSGFRVQPQPPDNLSDGVGEVHEGGDPNLLDSQVAPRRCNGSEAGSFLRLIDSGITQLKVHGPDRTCNESKEEEEEGAAAATAATESERV